MEKIILLLCVKEILITVKTLQARDFFYFSFDNKYTHFLKSNFLNNY